jgi:hypothetical protein
MQRRIFVSALGDQRLGLGPEAERRVRPIEGRKLVEHPVQRDMGQAIIRISTAHIGVNARKPDLPDATAGIDLQVLVPEPRMEGLALLVEGEGVAGVMHLTESRSPLAHVEGQDETSMARTSSLDRQAIGV